MNQADRLVRIMAKKSRRLIGLMSGMSMDGVDLACADFQGVFPDLKVQLIGTHFRPYSLVFKEALRRGQTGRVDEISALNVQVAQEFASCVHEFLEKNQIDPGQVDAIGSHGQTLFHTTDKGAPIRSTFQIGQPSIIAELTGLPTIGQFRARDIANGGHGAPLVSLADYVLFRDSAEPITLINLGSIANLTVVTPSADDVLAFDAGPANMALDFYARRIPDNESGIDRDGRLSGQGQVLPELLSSLLAHPFFQKTPPKAAGYAEFGPERLLAVSRPFLQHRSVDLLRTAVEFSAQSLEAACRDFVFPRFPNLKRAIFSGGGIYNQTLMKRIAERLPELRIEIMDSQWADAKEALAFALLANETLSGRPGSLVSVTGAQRPGLLGEIAL